jgi:aerobic-type carbon monoxide dehydrogenase small subunit (CoxS/CutS family)
MTSAGQTVTVDVEVNGRHIERTIPARLLLSDFLRHEIGLTGTHVGCEQGVCGACTVLLDDQPIRACLTLAAQVSGRRVRTVESVADPDKPLHPIQQALHDNRGLQCGFCTPGIVMTLLFLAEQAEAGLALTEADVTEALGGHLCRCTGYLGIVAAARSVLPISEAEGHD